jgi:hypothetical protein
VVVQAGRNGETEALTRLVDCGRAEAHIAADGRAGQHQAGSSRQRQTAADKALRRIERWTVDDDKGTSDRQAAGETTFAA